MFVMEIRVGSHVPGRKIVKGSTRAIYSEQTPEVTPKGSEFSKGILPKMAETFRLRIYNL